MINPLYYPGQATRLMGPNMTREVYENGYFETWRLVNCIIGVGNEVARLAIADGIKAVENSDLYRHDIKHWTKETFRQQENYENNHLRTFMQDRQKMFLDYLDAVEKEFRPHIFKVYMSLKQAMDRNQQSLSELKARVECGRVVATLACANFDVLMDAHREKYGVNYTALFQQFRYTQPMQAWSRVAEKIVRDDHPDRPTSLSDDPNCNLAYDILGRKMADFELINRIGYVAIQNNLETAYKFAKEEDIKELIKTYGVQKTG